MNMEEIQPTQCCGFGTYECQIPMPIRGRVCWIDMCIADIVAALNAANIETVASCCGHKKIDGNICLVDGREIIIKNVKNMTATGYSHGNAIEYDVSREIWVYRDTKTPILNNPRKCPKCGKMPTKEGYDACLGHIDRATSACCGHGVESGYVVRDGEYIKFSKLEE